MSEYPNVALVARLHAITASTGQSIAVEAYPAWQDPASSEPCIDTSATAVAVSFDFTDVPLTMKGVAVSGPGSSTGRINAGLALFIKGAQPATAAELKATVSVGLVVTH